ncbi:hypothetical protein [Nocardiopsis sp. B62]|uniref:hypothetical protein n=1 Tax=Nocardiopsis sp. B62 TaxID=2824874 RepID=UPI001B3675E5|nr:hypothetical protein [Nocardiopsis sp. B62]MBQ1081564.1 hypothetical protein [Nocardiopsis sp. B62]
MADANHPQAQVEPVLRRLRHALDRAGVVLPSLDADPSPVLNSRLIELGRVNVATADRLAEVIERGVGQ